LTRQIRDRLALRRKRRGTQNILLVASIIVALVVGAFLGLSNLPSEGGQNRGFFAGHLVNSQFVGSAEGVVQADRDCQSPDGIAYTCTAVIDQAEGTIYFHYTHNMQAQPCLAQGERVLLAARQDGTAVVTRLSQ
jgi:hypothetical protein